MRDFQLPGRSQVFSKSGMVATSHPVASLVGVSVLKNGGNAADAALAMALVLPICEPQSTGLFGDAFALIKPQGTLGDYGVMLMINTITKQQGIGAETGKKQRICIGN